MILPKVGDTVLLIYVGLVKVRSVDEDGTISFWLFGKEHTASRSQYRVTEHMGQYVRRYGPPKDYTSHDEGPSLAALARWLEDAGLTIDDVEIDEDGTIRRITSTKPRKLDEPRRERRERRRVDGRITQDSRRNKWKR